MKKHEIIFNRISKQFKIEALAKCSFETLNETEENSLDILQRAITSWINETEEGKEAHAISCYDFNIGDLALYQFDDLLLNWGINNLKITILEINLCVAFDHLLYRGK